MKHTTVLLVALLLVVASAGADDTIWVRTWLQGQQSRASGVVASGSDVFVAATTREEFNDILAVKYDAAGDTGWVRVVDLDTMETVIDIAVGADGQPVVCTWVEGMAMSAGLVKFTGTGETAWTRHLSAVMPTSVAVGAGNAVYVWAAVFDTLPMEAFTLARYGSDGTFAWQKSIRLGDGAQSAGCCADGSGNIIGAGVAFDSTGPRPMILKFNADGDTVWTKSLAGVGVDEMLGVAAGAGDTLVVTGTAGGDLRVLKLAPNGDTVWTRSFATQPTPEDRNNVAVDGQGAVVLLRTGPGGRSELFKLDPDGEVAWEGAVEIRAMPVAVCADGDDRPVSVGVTMEGVPAVLTIKWEGRSAVEEGRGDAGTMGPAHAGAVILDADGRLSFTAPVAGQYRVRLYDSAGALVDELHSGRLEPGEQALNVPGLAAGAYTLRVEGPQGTQQEKLVRVR